MKNIVKYIVLVLIISILSSCLSTDSSKKNDTPDFDIMLLEAQDATKNGKFQKAIDTLNNTLKTFPNKDIITIYYNIGFNYYKQEKFEQARKYLDMVINLFENSNFLPEQVAEYRKFVILAEILHEKINQDIEAKKDPYHIKEELEEKKKIKPKKG